MHEETRTDRHDDRCSRLDVFNCVANVQERLLKFDPKQYSALIQKPPTAPDLDQHLSLACPIDTVVDEIVLSPYADEAYVTMARASIAAADPATGNRVALSELSPLRYALGF